MGVERAEFGVRVKFGVVGVKSEGEVDAEANATGVLGADGVNGVTIVEGDVIGAGESWAIG